MTPAPEPAPLRRHWSHRIPVLGPVAMVRPRWSLAVLLGVAAYFSLERFPAPIRLIGAWDGGCLFFLAATALLAMQARPEDVRRRARIMDQGAVIVLLLTLLGVGVCLFTIIGGAKEVQGFAGSGGVAAALVGVTVVLSWLMTQASFALHYAYLYYGDSADDAGRHAGGLDFPDEPAPDYLDFAYFSFVLGMTFQVSDVQITDRGLRRVALLHGIVSFFFTTVILALTINMLADLAR